MCFFSEKRKQTHQYLKISAFLFKTNFLSIAKMSKSNRKRRNDSHSTTTTTTTSMDIDPQQTTGQDLVVENRAKNRVIDPEFVQVCRGLLKDVEKEGQYHYEELFEMFNAMLVVYTIAFNEQNALTGISENAFMDEFLLWQFSGNFERVKGADKFTVELGAKLLFAKYSDIALGRLQRRDKARYKPNYKVIFEGLVNAQDAADSKNDSQNVEMKIVEEEEEEG